MPYPSNTIWTTPDVRRAHDFDRYNTHGSIWRSALDRVTNSWTETPEGRGIWDKRHSPTHYFRAARATLLSIISDRCLPATEDMLAHLLRENPPVFHTRSRLDKRPPRRKHSLWPTRIKGCWYKQDEISVHVLSPALYRSFVSVQPQRLHHGIPVVTPIGGTPRRLMQLSSLARSIDSNLDDMEIEIPTEDDLAEMMKWTDWHKKSIRLMGLYLQYYPGGKVDAPAGIYISFMTDRGWRWHIQPLPPDKPPVATVRMALVPRIDGYFKQAHKPIPLRLVYERNKESGDTVHFYGKVPPVSR